MKRLACALVGLLVVGCCPLTLQRGVPAGMHPVDRSEPTSEAPPKKRMTSPEQFRPPVMSRPIEHMP
jgi:hypothetical protein